MEIVEMSQTKNFDVCAVVAAAVDGRSGGEFLKGIIGAKGKGVRDLLAGCVDNPDDITPHHFKCFYRLRLYNHRSILSPPSRSILIQDGVFLLMPRVRGINLSSINSIKSPGAY
jgi:hypothetical protein